MRNLPARDRDSAMLDMERVTRAPDSAVVEHRGAGRIGRSTRQSGATTNKLRVPAPIPDIVHLFITIYLISHHSSLFIKCRREVRLVTQPLFVGRGGLLPGRRAAGGRGTTDRQSHRQSQTGRSRPTALLQGGQCSGSQAFYKVISF